MKKIGKIVICVFLMLVCLSGCGNNKKELRIYGGDIIKNSAIMVNEKYLAYELPIISNQKIDSLEIREYNVSGEGSYDIKYEKLSGGEEYNGWYYYFVNLKIKVDNNVNADLSIDSVNMYINKQSVKYEISDMHFVNAKEYLGSDCDTQKRNFVYNCEKTFMYQFIPQKNTQTITIDIQKDCTITRFDFYDFVSINNLVVKVNGKKTNSSDNIVVKKGDSVSFQYTLSYKQNVPSMNLLKTTAYITYRDESGNKCAFVEEQGLMIVNFQNDSFVKKYIDKKLRR